jgi:hypothetical protein
MSTLWILTEERPKKEVLQEIFKRFAKDRNIAFIGNNLRILPILEDGKFSFTYKIEGFITPAVKQVIIKTISGSASFVDFMVFFQDDKPVPGQSVPIYLIEETKTDDAESRNTGVYQRCSKFVFLENYYPAVPKIMLYTLRVPQKPKPTQTYIFGTRLLKTIGVEILGKVLDPAVYIPFGSVDEVIAFKDAMRPPPEGNVPITLRKFEDRIEISGRLWKSGSLSHDPNIGALSLICFALRKLGWKKRLVITQHGLEQSNVTPNGETAGKFLKIATDLNIELQGLLMPVVRHSPEYWKYEDKGEKLGTIFIHLVVEEFTEGFSIFENHAGCEKGYFQTANGKYLALEKYTDKALYKAGDKTQIFHIPDLILIDCNLAEVINVEGKTYANRLKGIAELNNYDPIEEHYIKKHYPDYKITRTVVLYGSKETKIVELKISFLLNQNGELILGVQAPELFKTAIKNLKDFWAGQNI